MSKTKNLQEEIKKFIDNEASLGFCTQKYAERIKWYIDTYFTTEYAQSPVTGTEGKTDFLAVLEENYSALFHKDAEDIVNEKSAIDAVKETYEDLISIYKKNYLTIKGSDTFQQILEQVYPYNIKYLNDLITFTHAEKAAELYANQHTQPVTACNDLEIGTEWISVKDRLPEKVGSYLCFLKNDHPILDNRIAVIFRSDTWTETNMQWLNNFTITHWQPLPSPPKEK